MDVTVTVVKIDKIEVFSSYPFIKNDLFTNMTTVYDTESHVSSRESVEVLPRKKKMLCNNHEVATSVMLHISLTTFLGLFS